MSQLYVTNPFDDSPVGEVKLFSENEVGRALAIADKTYKTNRKGLPRHERITILKNAVEIMKGRKDELAMLIARKGESHSLTQKLRWNAQLTALRPVPPILQIMRAMKYRWI